MDEYTRGDRYELPSPLQVYCFSNSQIPAFQIKRTVLALKLPVHWHSITALVCNNTQITIYKQLTEAVTEQNGPKLCSHNDKPTYIHSAIKSLTSSLLAAGLCEWLKRTVLSRGLKIVSDGLLRNFVRTKNHERHHAN